MTQDTDASPTEIRSQPSLAKAIATYSPWEFQIVINAQEAEVFDSAGGLSAQTKYYPVVWHEYVHYLQNIGTTIGCRTFLNLIAVLSRFSGVIEYKNPLIVPMSRDTSNQLPGVLNDFIAEMGSLVGLVVPLDHSPPASVRGFHPYIDPKDSSHALLCLEGDGKRVGVSLRSDAFSEGMAKSVQLLATDATPWTGEYLKGRPIDKETVYYDALLRYFMHHSPKADARVVTILVSHAALQTTQPAAFFYVLHENGLAQRANNTTPAELCRFLRQHAHVANGIGTGIQELNRFAAENKHKAGSELHDMLVELTQLMSKALAAYVSEDDAFAALINPTLSGLTALANHFYFPPLYTLGIDTGWTIKLPDALKNLFFLVASMWSLASATTSTNLTTECHLLRKRYCTFPKNKASYCCADRLNFREVDGSLCVMGQAAMYLSLYRKPLKRLA